MNRDSLLPFMNQEILTDRDEALGLGYKRIALWEQLGEHLVPYDKQVPILMTPAKEIYVVSSRGTGKSHIGAVRVMEELLMPNRKVHLIGPTYNHCSYVFDKVYNACMSSPLLQSKVGRMVKNNQEQSIQLKVGTQGSVLKVLSTKDPDAVIGFETDLLVADEAGIIENEAYELVKPTLNRAARMGKFLAISSPRGDNWFKEMWKLANRTQQKLSNIDKARLRAFKLHILDNPFSSSTDYYAAKEEAYAIGTAYKIGQFKKEWDGDFDSMTGEVFSFTEDIWFPRNFYTPYPNEHVTIGIDYARLYDSTVCTAFTDEYKMVGYDKWNQLGDDQNIDRICKFIASLYTRGRVLDVIIDATGEGSGIPREVERRLKDKYGIYGVRILGFKFTNDKKNQLVERLCVKLASEDIAMWDEPEIKDELLGYRAEETAKGHITFEGIHDDIVCSLMLSIGHVRDNRFTVY
jgi:hypothetical protein